MSMITGLCLTFFTVLAAVPSATAQKPVEQDLIVSGKALTSTVQRFNNQYSRFQKRISLAHTYGTDATPAELEAFEASELAGQTTRAMGALDDIEAICNRLQDQLDLVGKTQKATAAGMRELASLLNDAERQFAADINQRADRIQNDEDVATMHSQLTEIRETTGGYRMAIRGAAKVYGIKIRVEAAEETWRNAKAAIGQNLPSRDAFRGFDDLIKALAPVKSTGPVKGTGSEDQ
jgi:hypothetical protein